MSSDLQIEHSIEILESIYNEPLPCHIGYLECVKTATWISDGSCPNCQASSPGRLVCAACHQNIVDGHSMQHKHCGYTGKGADFFRSFRAL